MYISRLIIAAVLSVIAIPGFSKSYNKIWGAASLFYKYKQLFYTVEPQIRLVNRTGIYEQSLLNAGIGTTIRPQLQFWLGQTYANYSDINNVSEDVGNTVTNEYRVWEQLLWRKPFYDEFASRLRLEQRRAFEASEWAVRVRERAYWTIPLTEKVSFALNDEIFLNLKSVRWVSTSLLDQNRLFIGVFYKFTPKIGLNISYMNQYIARNPAEINNGLVLNLIAYMY